MLLLLGFCLQMSIRRLVLRRVRGGYPGRAKSELFPSPLVLCPGLAVSLWGRLQGTHAGKGAERS